MKKLIKNNIKLVIGIILGTIISGIVVYATIEASSVTYNGTTVDLVLNDLYSRLNNSVASLTQICTYPSEGSYGQKGEVGALYDCEVGPNIHQNFYLLADHGKEVKMLMYKNITSDTTMMTWMNAIKYIDSNNLKSTWSNTLDVDLPSSQDIANAVGNTTWKYEDQSQNGWFCLGLKDQSSCAAGNWTYTTEAGKTAVANYVWLFNYTRGCTSFGCTESLGELNDASYTIGYWTKDVIAQRSGSNIFAWSIHRGGFINNGTATDSNGYGVRPVITILKSQLSN